MPENKVYLFDFIEGCPAQNVTLSRGKYFFEAWGASGGGEKGGLGGYTSGYLSLYNTKTFFLYVGGKGTDPSKGSDVSPGGCNGGGDGGKRSSDPDLYNSGGGGGATDIRLTINTEYADRILVAAGGGGQCGKNITYGNGGYGGGLVGGNSTGYYNISKGATQTTGHLFGIGQDGKTGTPQTYGSEGSGGGGGGWYGGLSYQGKGINSNAGGGGGSSYISGHPLCKRHPKYSFTLPILKGGNQEFEKPDSSAYLIGNKGNGYARISYFSELHLKTCQITRIQSVVYILIILFIK